MKTQSFTRVLQVAERIGEIVVVLLFGAMMYFVLAA